jgi:hypothetical protein
MAYVYACRDCETPNSLKREDGAFVVEHLCSECGEWLRVQVCGPDLELTVAKGAAPWVMR